MFSISIFVRFSFSNKGNRSVLYNFRLIGFAVVFLNP